MLPPKLFLPISTVCKFVELVNEQRKFELPCHRLLEVLSRALSHFSCLICAKEGSSPMRWLSPIWRRWRLETLDIYFEIHPMKRLIAKLSCLRFGSVNPKLLGKLPSSLFPITSRDMTEDILNIELGKMLTNLFRLRMCWCRFLSRPRVSGILPPRLFYVATNPWSEDKFPNEDSTFPIKLFSWR